MEEIAAAAPSGYRWFQLYVHRDRALTEQIVQRVEALGYKALVLTVDVPYTGKRRNNLRNQFKLPPHLRVQNLRRAFQVGSQYLQNLTTKKLKLNPWQRRQNPMFSIAFLACQRQHKRALVSPVDT